MSRELDPEDYLNDPNPVCPRCCEPKDDIKRYFNHYVNACGAEDEDSWEIMCGDCAYERHLAS